MTSCPTPFELEAYAVSDLRPARVRQVEAHLEACSSCQSALSSWQQQAAPFATNIEAHVSELHRRLASVSVVPVRRWRQRWQTWGATFFIAAAAAVLAVMLLPAVTPKDQPALVSYKGQVSLQVVAKRQGRQFFVQQGVSLKPQDRLRFVLSTYKAGYMTLVSIDNSGRVWALYPPQDAKEAAAPWRIDAPGRHELPDSVLLDDELGSETFVAVFAENSFNRKQVHDRIAQLWRESGRAGLTTSAIGLKTEAQLVVVAAQKIPLEGRP